LSLLLNQNIQKSANTTGHGNNVPQVQLVHDNLHEMYRKIQIFKVGRLAWYFSAYKKLCTMDHHGEFCVGKGLYDAKIFCHDGIPVAADTRHYCWLKV
jgi:hypothetical protein